MSVAANRTAELPSVAPADFKSAMRLLPAGVAVITSRHAGRMNGMTATAVTSVSVEPPLALAVVNRSSRSHELIASGAAFAINILSVGQEQLAQYFAGRSEKPFSSIAHRLGLTGCPMLEGCAAAFELSLHHSHDLGTHTLFVGRVVDSVTTNRSPLIYHDGGFSRLATG